MPRLLMVTTISRTIRAFLVPYAEHFRSKGWHVHALANGILTDSAAEHFDAVHDIAWTRRPTDVREALRAVERVRSVVEEGGYDVVHVHTPIAAFVTRFALRHRNERRGPQLVYTAHGLHFHRGGGRLRNTIFAYAERVAGRWTDFLVVINQEDFQAARRLRLVPEERLWYMPGIGIRASEYDSRLVTDAQIANARFELGICASDALFVIVAELIPRKRQQDAIRALALLNNACVHLALVGNGPSERKLRLLAVRLGVADRVHFLGFRKDVQVLICAATATILPSGQEGLARAVMESLALGVPVLGSDARGIRDLLANECGIIVPVGDVSGLARAMSEVIASPASATRMASRGRERVRTIYDLERLLRLHEELYDRALQAQPVALPC